MTFPDSPRVIYEKNPLEKVICQLRFPPILSINTNDPSEFQEAIRNNFPLYELKKTKRQELSFEYQESQIVPKSMETSTIKNHKFSSEDDMWHINLTNTFISLSTNNYIKWEDFLKTFEEPLKELINIYKPAYFTRIGLRYIDVFCRSELQLEDSSWSELLKPFVIGFLNAEELSEFITTNNIETEINLDDGKSNVKIRAYLSTVPGGTDQFIIDSDFYSFERLDLDLDRIKDKLEYLHTNSTNFLRWVITTKLHDAMKPKELKNTK